MTGEIFTVERRVRFADCDAAGIVFFPRYFEMLNGVVEDWFAGPLEASFRELHVNRHVSVPTAAVEARFITPSRLEDELTFALSVTKLGGASCGLRHRISAGGELRFEATQTIVYVGASLKPEPWPAPLRTRIAPFVETSR
ncbi:MAG: acyl-CoA thioesterase [Alphaproteobacteria bacterium]|uniref:acyl-CoA thioesterase n=1 Tax=Brevundimonas sp. TaxID=1871086 RepID=UPI0018388924|nr:thioesterase family protein [Brevundimonas sp.]MBU3969297.1 acyl-CoA thioesterase [Alphaproteobacteria bacterium]MBA3051420.1 acyl-CoA thioesterase [Brevundimonas sp.]MBU3973874.1 acyl-CoA thioesterase [Alphaproteobacteria bacterium]MBU4039245.1 acyl-CoA thioesterase [Alphaproteobacteria bacterium]MBU4135828.1 acyl-CoA thioesterase [Alphaproteobacteria bacterium]